MKVSAVQETSTELFLLLLSFGSRNGNV